jgi:hypothetical protein
MGSMMNRNRVSAVALDQNTEKLWEKRRSELTGLLARAADLGVGVRQENI